MVDSVVFLEKITAKPPYDKIYSRLGHKKKTTEITDRQRQETDIFIEEALSFIFLKGALLRKGVKENDGKKIAFAGGLTFASKKLARFLEKCPEALFMGATAGEPIMSAITERMNKDNFFAAVVYDATASEMVDAALSWMMSYFNRQLSRDGKRLLTRRFSAGYGDFALENQKEIYEQLQMKNLGVTITPERLLMPEKSVTAICGISGGL